MRRKINFIILIITTISYISPAEEPVYFADANLKAVVEDALDIINPTPTDMLGLTSLYAHSSGISNLTGLEFAANLGVVDLCRNQISDMSPLSGLTKLGILKIFSNQISDISPLAGLTDLEWIDLSDNRVSNISALSGLTRLERLWLNINLISDISPLSELKSLQWLVLDRNQISDVSPLSGLTSLQVLSLTENQISDISPLYGLMSLQSLTLHSNQISNISPLSELTSLELLWLGNNQISDISLLSGLTGLKELLLGTNQISNISPLSGLTSLEDLKLSINHIRDLSPIAGLTNLQILSLGYNQVSDISPLSGLTSLQFLYLDYNQISDLSPFSGLVNLEALYVLGNPLSIDDYTIYIPLFESYGTTVHYDPLVWCKLTISSTVGGSVVEPGEGDFNYKNFTVVNIKAVANPGYHFVNWTRSAVNTGKVVNPVSVATAVTLEADYTLQANFRQIQFGLYVDDDAPNDPGAGNPEISDKNEDGSREHPFDTIQEAIDAAVDSCTVLVYPGIYQEEIHFLGKAITVQGEATSDGIPILENPDGIAVSFYSAEEPNSTLKNFIIRNSLMAVYIISSSPTVSNITIVDNKIGIGAFGQAEPNITNSIFWNNSKDDLLQCQAHYSCIERGGEGEGNINVDPLLVNPNNSDYHLLSKRGRYWQEHHVWILDNSTSPCIDAGNPLIDPSAEPSPNGGRINMGAYGGTAYASMSD